MSTEVRWRRGTDAQHEAFIGAMSEITHDTTNNNLRVHDGVTEGGHATLMAREKGAAGGIATLDENGLVPESQLGNVSIPDKSDYGSITAVETAEIKEDVQYLRTAGYYAPGDGGGALYKRVATEPSHAGKVQSADGAWWEIAENTVNVRFFGAKGDGASNDTAPCQDALDYAIQAAMTYRGAPDVFFPEGTYLVDGLVFGPVDYVPIKIHGSGKATTFIRKRLAASSSNVIQIGNDPSTTYRGEIEIADMTIDGYDGYGVGLALFEVWYSCIRNVRISNCHTGIAGNTAIYIDLYSPDITWNTIGVDINHYPDASFAGAKPAVINFFGGIIWRNSQVGILADHFNSIHLYGTGLEKNGTSNTATEGAIVTGENVNRNGFANGVTMFGGWLEDNKGTGQVRFGSGFNALNNVRFWQPDGLSPYAVHVVGGKYLMNACTITSVGSAIIKEESGVSTGNKISLCNGFTYQVERNKTSIDEGASQSVMYQTVGGAGTTGASLVIQDTSTYFQFSIEDGRLKLKQGTMEVDSWG